MFYFIFYYLWYLTLLPLCILLIYPFYKINIFYCAEIIIDSLKFNIIILKEEEYITEGFVLANHRSFTDFVIDPYLAQCPFVCRRLAFLVLMFMNIYYYIEIGSVVINRKKESRNSIFHKMLKYKKVLFWPEGTRLRYTILNSPADVKKYLRYGLLKEIYYHKVLPVQLQISGNKELVIDERKFIINKGITVKSFISEPIYPENYNSEQEFYDAIAEKWYNSWIIVNSDLQSFENDV